MPVCVQCSGPLDGRRRKFCGDACKEASLRDYYRAYHQARRPARELVVQCGACGATIERSPTDIGQPRKFCDRDCRNRYRAYRAWGLDSSWYARTLAEQGGGCAICGSTNPGGSHGKFFAVDHCHDGGHVRGLLCSPCNQGLGLFYDDPDRLRAAAEYIERNH